MQKIPVYDSANKISHTLQELLELFKYRSLIFQLIRRDILTRYKRSVLGVIWTMLNPLGIMLILSFVFSNIFGFTQSYPAFVLTGLIVWNFFAQTTTAAMASLVWGGDMLKRIYIPRASFGISATGSGLVNLVLALVPLVIVLLFTGSPIRITAIYFPIPLLLIACFTLGLGLALSVLALYFPDVAEMYQIILNGWMYITPLIYPESAIPEKYHWVLHLNPMYYLVNLWRAPVYDGRWPTWGEFWPAAAIGIGMLLIGWIFFTSKSDEFAYRI